MRSAPSSKPKRRGQREPARRTATTSAVALHRYTANDQAAFVGWMVSDHDALTFIGKSFPSGTADPPRLLGCFARLRRAGISHFAWAVVDEAGELVGHVELKKTAKVGDRELELIYIIRRELRRRGFATDAVRQALTIVDESTDGSAVVAFVNPRNVASRRVLERVGFTAAHLGDSEYRYRLESRRR